jgi:hypothetical protein
MVTLTNILNRGDYLENPKSSVLARNLTQAIANARSICSAEGFDSDACVKAWALVEDLQAEAAYLENTSPVEMTAFQQYCLEHPEILRVRHHDLAVSTPVD